MIEITRIRVHEECERFIVKLISKKVNDARRLLVDDFEQIKSPLYKFYKGICLLLLMLLALKSSRRVKERLNVSDLLDIFVSTVN